MGGHIQAYAIYDGKLFVVIHIRHLLRTMNKVVLIGGGEDVIGDEKYEWVIWKESIICPSIVCRSVYCVNLRKLVFGMRYLYLLYSHIGSISNDWVWGYVQHINNLDTRI